MLSMCSIWCRLVRGWKQTEATSLMAQAAVAPGSSLMIQDLSGYEENPSSSTKGDTPSLNNKDISLKPYSIAQSYMNDSTKSTSSMFCQYFTCEASPSNEGDASYCGSSCTGKAENVSISEDAKPDKKIIWCDNNKQASVITPRQIVKLDHWTLFMTDRSTESTPEVTLSSSLASDSPLCGSPSSVPQSPSSPVPESPKQESSALLPLTTQRNMRLSNSLITVLLEARYMEKEELSDPHRPVLVESVSKAYAWRCRRFFDVIAHTNAVNFMVMVEAFFNNCLMLDNDLRVTKLINNQTSSQMNCSQKSLIEQRLDEMLSTPKQCVERASSGPRVIVTEHQEHEVLGESVSSTEKADTNSPDGGIAAGECVGTEDGEKSAAGGEGDSTAGGGDQKDNRPPNILVYTSNNDAYFNAIKSTLLQCFKTERYAIYHLDNDTAFTSPWSANTSLLVICGNVQSHIDRVFIRYLLDGGKVLSICSDFLNMAVPLFGTVELAESPVVQVRYGKWRSVAFLHHEHCSHSTHNKSRFSSNFENSVESTEGGERSVAKKVSGTVSVEPTYAQVTDVDGSTHRLQLSVLATDNTWSAPSIIGATVEGGSGRAVFSQVHLEDLSEKYDPSVMSLEEVKESAEARKEILRDLLSNQLSMDTLDTEEQQQQMYQHAVLIGENKLKRDFMEHVEGKLLPGRVLHRPQMELRFVQDHSSFQSSAESLSVVSEAECEDFDECLYSRHLTTQHLGRLLLYTPVIGSTHRVVEGTTKLWHGFTVTAKRQTQGTGRGGNVWLSPPGCLMFSIQLHLPLSSFLGTHLPLIQHVASLAVVRAFKNHTDKLSIKWPNDLLLGDSKIGGNIVTTSHCGNIACVNIGMGINLTNAAPTVSIQSVIKESSPSLKSEVILACILNELESVILRIECQGPEWFIEEYCNNWRHQDAVVEVLQGNAPSHPSASGNFIRRNRTVCINGIDSFGFLKGTDCNTGETLSIHPDGNSFNMMEGLVYTKVKK